MPARRPLRRGGCPGAQPLPARVRTCWPEQWVPCGQYRISPLWQYFLRRRGRAMPGSGVGGQQEARQAGRPSRQLLNSTAPCFSLDGERAELRRPPCRTLRLGSAPQGGGTVAIGQVGAEGQRAGATRPSPLVVAVPVWFGALRLRGLGVGVLAVGHCSTSGGQREGAAWARVLRKLRHGFAANAGGRAVPSGAQAFPTSLVVVRPATGVAWTAAMRAGREHRRRQAGSTGSTDILHKGGRAAQGRPRRAHRGTSSAPRRGRVPGRHTRCLQGRRR